MHHDDPLVYCEINEIKYKYTIESLHLKLFSCNSEKALRAFRPLHFPSLFVYINIWELNISDSMYFKFHLCVLTENSILKFWYYGRLYNTWGGCENCEEKKNISHLSVILQINVSGQGSSKNVSGSSHTSKFISWNSTIFALDWYFCIQ